MRNKKILAFAFAALLLVSGSVAAISSSNALGVAKKGDDLRYPEESLSGSIEQEISYTNHTSIRIDNNTDFADQAASEGWPGNGSEGNPYIIQGYDIDGGGHGCGIYIGNTTVHFVVRDCYLHNASGNYDTYFENAGLNLYDVENGRVENNNASLNTGSGIRLESSPTNSMNNNTVSLNDKSGIYLRDSNEVTVSNNTVFSNGQKSIYLAYSDQVSLLNNSLSDDQGVFMYRSTNNIFDNNTMQNEGILIGGSHVTNWNTHSIDTSNTVNGKPVYYWKDQTGGTVPQGAGEVILANCDGVTVKNQSISDSYYGIVLGFSDENIITNNTVSSNDEGGIFLDHSNENLISENNAYDNGFCGIGAYRESDNNRIENNTATGNNYGIRLSESSYNMIEHNTVLNNQQGIYLYFHSDYNTITDNRVNSNGLQGITLHFYCENNTVTKNNASNGHYGIYIRSVDNNTIQDNIALSNLYSGIWLHESNFNILQNNNVSHNDEGIYLDESNNNTMEENTAYNNTQGIRVETASNNTLRENAAINNSYGIYLSSADDNLLLENTAPSNEKNGITLYESSYNVVEKNTAYLSVDGLDVTDGSENLLKENILYSNNYGIDFYQSNENTAFNNTLLDNGGGVNIYSSYGNLIYHNRFINNTNQANENTYNNRWNASYPTGGNYWSDYEGYDNYSGPAQNLSGSDGIGDTNYSATIYNADEYPLMSPYGPPDVLSTDPDSEETNVSLNKNITIVFSETLNTSDQPILEEVNNNGASYSFAGWNSTYMENDTATWTHTGWPDDTEITLRVSDYSDMEGELSGNYTWSFKTLPINYPPHVPVDPLPADGATDVSTSPTLSVNVSDPDQNSMTVRFYNASDDSLIAAQEDVENGSRASVVWDGLALGHTYSWYAVANDSQLQNTSSTWSFTTTTENYAPLQPSNPSPVDGATDVGISPTLSVDVSDNDGDTMNVTFYNASDDSIIGTNSDIPDGGTASVTWSGLSYSRSYGWYAVANDSIDATPSVTWTFDTISDPNVEPDEPIQPVPADGSGGIGTSPTLSVDVSDPNGDPMTVTFYNASDDTEVGNNTGVTNGTTSVVWNGLSTNTTYSWYAVADDGSLTNRSDTWSFTTTAGNSAPDVPGEPVPADGAVDVGTSPTLSVNVSDADGDTMTVTFYNALDDSIIDTNSGVTNGTTSITGSGLSHNTTYEWYAIANDSQAETQSPTWSFTTVEDDNQDPTADAGEDRTVEEDTTVTFNGSGSSDNVGITDYTWTIEGSEYSGIEVQHTFNEPGNYTVTLNVSDEAGNSDTDTAYNGK